MTRAILETLAALTIREWLRDIANAFAVLAFLAMLAALCLAFA